MTIDQIKAWSMFGGVGCVVISASNGWHNTACFSFRTGDHFLEDRPKRVCSRCRAAIPSLRPVEPK